MWILLNCKSCKFFAVLELSLLVSGIVSWHTTIMRTQWIRLHSSLLHSLASADCQSLLPLVQTQTRVKFVHHSANFHRNTLSRVQFRAMLSSFTMPSGAIPFTYHSSEKGGPLEVYESMVARGILQHDARQHKVAVALEELLGKMRDHQRLMEVYHEELRKWLTKRNEEKRKLLQEEANFAAQRKLQRLADERKKGLLTLWLSRRAKKTPVEPGAGFMVAHIKREKKLDLSIGSRPLAPQAPQGLYLHGNVGCGKTLLMDLFFNAAGGVVRYRRRLHFHAAMLEVHHRMHKLWSQQRGKKADPRELELNPNSAHRSSTLTLDDAVREWLDAEERYESELQTESAILEAVADELLGSWEGESDGGASLLCFDEVQVVDVFTAVALAGILGRLLRRGVVIVATSNRAPCDLNKEGMQKEIFAAFVAELERQCCSVLVGTDTDYRHIMAKPLFEKGQQMQYFWPLGTQSQLELERHWDEITTSLIDKSGASVGSDTIPVMFGRELEVPKSCNGVARFTFEQVCDRLVGAADYIALAQYYHTVFVTDIPIMSMRIRDKARRFITLVDELYNHRCHLICTAASPPDELFLGTADGPLVDLESLQFETDAEGSRLRRDVTAKGSVAPVGSTEHDRASIHSLLSGREELFAFRRAVSRLIEMQTPTYLQTLNCHPRFQGHISSNPKGC